MTNNKLLRVVLSLNDMETKQFSKFINSPYFNERTELIQFWKLLSKQKNGLLKDWKKIFFKQIFPQKVYTDVSMRKLMTQLNNLIQKFLIVHYLEKDEWLSKKILLQCYGQKNLTKEFDSAMINLKENIHLAPLHNYDLAFESFDISKIYYLHPSTSKLQPKEAYLTEAMNQLDQFYISSKLHYATEQINRDQIFSQKNSVTLLNDIKNYVKRTPQKSPLIELYLNLQELLQEGYNLKKFTNCESIFLKEEKHLTPEKRISILVFMINIIIKGLNLGHLHLAKKILELYKMGIKKSILIQNNRITHETFTNVVVFSANLGENKYARKFISNYSQLLDISVKEDAVHFCETLIDFYDKKYLNVIEQLSIYKHDKGLFDIRAKSILIRALVEQYLLDQDYYLLFDKKAKTIDRYLRRKEKLGKDRINGYLKLHSYSVKIIHLLQEGSAKPNDWTSLINKIKKEKYLYARKWLLDVIQRTK